MTTDGAGTPDLQDVTLVAATSVAIEATVAALKASMEQARFGHALLLSDLPPRGGIDARIEWRAIPRLGSRLDYSRFMLRELAGLVTTSHALCVQWDGFVINGAGWRDDFLRYDYIGAVWPQFADDHRVGNGGFSLRSRHLLDACRELPFDGTQAEDIVIGRTYRSQLEEQGIIFAPEAVAAAFAYERVRPKGGEFGFHGAFNLVERLSVDDVVRLFRGLDRNVLTRGERTELLRWALGRKSPKLIGTMLARLA